MRIMRFEQLEYLTTIAETNSFSAAAQKLYITQQAISLSMKQLEQEIGQQLFIKENNKTVLTVAGERLLQFAQTTLQEKEFVLDELQNISQNTQPLHITIGSTSCVANIALPNIIAKFDAKKQNVTFQISIMERLQNVLEQVVSGEKEIGLISMNVSELERKFKKYSDLLELDVLARDELVVVMNRNEYQGKKAYITEDEWSKKIKTIYNIDSTDEWQESAKNISVIKSNDADFHRRMIEHVGAYVAMSGLSYQYFFNSKRYVSLPLKEHNVQIIHAAVYRKDAGQHIREIVYMIRKEMHLQ